MKQRDPQQDRQGRRGFLRQAGQTGLLAGAAALGAAAGKQDSEVPAAAPGAEEKRGYHESEHIRQYYRTSGVF